VTQRTEHRLAALALAITLLGIIVGLHSDVLSGGLSTRIGGGFHPGHAWAMDRVASMLWGSAPWSGEQIPMGYPDIGHVRLIGWGGLLIGAVWVPLLGLIPAYHLTVVLTVLLSAWVSTLLIHRVTGAGPLTAAGASLVYALGPMALGFLANGQLAKLHLWCLPLCLLLADLSIREDRRRWALPATGLAAALAGFSAPSIGLLLPFALGPWVLLRATGSRRWWWAGAVLLVAAAGLVLPMLYHQLPGAGIAVLRPASPIPGLVHPVWLSPVARPAEILLGWAPWSAARDGINNVSYLGLPALVGGLLLARRGTAQRLGLALLGLGILLALGPAIDGESVRWVLPAIVLEWARYPIVQSGMYYRFGQVAALGLALLIAGGLSGRRGPALAWTLGALNIAAGIWATQALWPRPLQAFPGAPLYAQMAADPIPGAVLDLPLETIDTDGSKAALAQALHGRPSTALVHNLTIQASPRLRQLDALVRGLSRSPSPHQALAQAGFRYVVLRPTRDRHRPDVQARRLSTVLGAPAEDGGVRVWTIPQPGPGG